MHVLQVYVPSCRQRGNWPLPEASSHARVAFGRINMISIILIIIIPPRYLCIEEFEKLMTQYEN